MRAPRVALIVDHPQRDLGGLVLVAHRLCQRGIECHLVPHNLREPEIWSLSPDLVLLNFLRRGSETFAQRLVEAGIRFGLLDTEGGAWTRMEDYAQLLWPDEVLRARARPLCLWGPRLAGHLTASGRFAPGNVRVTGCPRFDLYDPKWRSVALNGTAADPTRTPRPRILVNTNFSLTNPRFATVEQNLTLAREELGWSIATVDAMVAAERCAIAGMIELVQRLALDFPESLVVLRPHPFERPDTYEPALRARSNVVLNVDGPVQPQILQAAVVVQRSCSTAVEACLAGIPTLSPQWIPAPILVPMAEEVSVPSDTYAELRSQVGAALDGGFRPGVDQQAAIDAVVRDWFFKADGLAHERVADAVAAELSRPSEVEHDVCRRLLYASGTSDEPLPARLGRLTRRALHLSPSFSFRQMRRVAPTAWQRTDKRFDAAEVQCLAARIEDAAHGRGEEPQPVVIGASTSRGSYSFGYLGYSVTLAPAGPIGVR